MEEVVLKQILDVVLDIKSEQKEIKELLNEIKIEQVIVKQKVEDVQTEQKFMKFQDRTLSSTQKDTKDIASAIMTEVTDINKILKKLEDGIIDVY